MKNNLISMGARLRYRRKAILGIALSAILIAQCDISSAQINLGIVAPATGPFAMWGAEIFRGADLAAADINSRGGINGKKIELIKLDDSCRPDQAAEKTAILIQRDKVHALIGYPCAAAALASSRVAIESNVLMISLATVPELTHPNQSILRIVGRSDRLAQFTAEYVAANFKSKKIGTLVFQNRTAFDNTLQTTFDKKGIKIDKTEAIATPTGILPTWENDVDVIIAPNMVAQSLKVTPRTKPTVVIPASIVWGSIAELQNERNVIVISNPRPDFFTGATDIVRRAGFSKPEESGYAIYSYAAIQLFAAIARATNNNYQGRVLADAARKSTNQTVLGKLIFDQSGELQHWQFAAYGAASGPNVCKSPECKQYTQCPADCPIK